MTYGIFAKRSMLLTTVFIVAAFFTFATQVLPAFYTLQEHAQNLEMTMNQMEGKTYLPQQTIGVVSSNIISTPDTQHPLKTTSKNRLLFHLMFVNEWEKFDKHMMRTIESIFFHHPDAEVIIHTDNDLENVTLPLLQPLWDEKFDLKLEKMDVLQALESLRKYDALNATLLQKFIDGYTAFYTNEKIFWHRRKKQVSNIYRKYLLYTRGGFYMDMDVLVVKPLDSLGENVIGKEEPSLINGALIRFQPGSKFLVQAFENMFKDFRPAKHGHQGPRLLTRTMNQYYPKCQWKGKDKPSLINDPNCPADILEIDAFYPMHHTKYMDICMTRNITDAKAQEWKKTIERKSFVAHCTGKNKSIATSPNTLCRWLKNKFCTTKKTCAMVV